MIEKKAYYMQLEKHIPSVPTFLRDRVSWFCYILLGFYTYLQSSLGPLASLFQQRFHLSYASTSIPNAAFASGIVLVSLCGERVMRLWAHHVTRWLWLNGAGMVLGTICLILSPNILLVAGSTFIMGTCGGVLLITIQAVLSDYHGEQRATALTEANILAGMTAGFAPLLVGGFQYIGLGWQTALYVALGLFLVLVVRFRQITIPTTQTDTIEQSIHHRHFPLAFWFYWIVLACSVAMEWSMIVWSAIFLHNTGIQNSSLATITVALFFAAEVIGRLLGSRLTRCMKSTTLLLTALGITACGFMLFWAVPLLQLKIVGLFLTGLGIANLYPLTVAIAIGTTPGQTHTASMRLTSGASLATLGAPFLLGRIADVTGIQRAYGIVPGLLLVAVVLTLRTLDALKNQNRKRDFRSE